MTRYFIIITYQGTAYHGWQIQHNALSVQQVVNEALSKVLGETIMVMGSGRTDTGVHAHGQVAHFDTAQALTDHDAFRFNAVLPHDISIDALYPVAADLHARFSAVSRRYVYQLHQHKDPFLHQRSYYFRPSLDIALMNQAALLLITLESQSYACFSKSGSDVSDKCRIEQAEWRAVGPDRWIFEITADRFLRGMVRAIVGTLLDVGTHKTDLDTFQAIIASQDRQRAGRSVPACGLYLMEVKYR